MKNKMKFRSVSSIALLLLFVVTINESRSYHGIGARVEGDKLLANITERSPTRSTTPKNHTIKFAHPLNNDELLSFVELTSESNVHAEIVLNYDNTLHGMATAVEALDFELTILIYAINEKDAPAGFHPALTANRPFEAMMMSYDDDYEEYENFDWLHNDENILPLGQRQPGDALVYKTYQYSDSTEKPSNHSVVFYYIDSYYLTRAEFYTIQTETATATFSHTSDHSIKAVIYDTNVKSLDVRFHLYGYRPDNKPDSFRPLLPRLPPLREEVFIAEPPPPSPAPECPPTPSLSRASTKSFSKLVFIMNFLVAGSVLGSLDGF